MWKLVIEDDEGKRTVLPLSRDDYGIGRQEGNAIRLTERNVSRQHARLRRNRIEDGRPSFFIEDLRSYNGVFVNGVRITQPKELLHGDLIQVGDYRVILQDDAVELADATLQMPTETKTTIPEGAVRRGQMLAEQPNRLVMLVGPTPGVEFALDGERMTVGRSEDANISVNHNSVSRRHCEIHALGDGRFEILDKGSANSVRVNSVELRRSIIEAGDIIELGDVRFKFIGAGQVFVPGVNESQRLTAITDREAEQVMARRGLGAYTAPILGAGFVGALAILGVTFMVRGRATAHQPPAAVSADSEPERAPETALDEAPKTVTSETAQAPAPAPSPVAEAASAVPTSEATVTAGAAPAPAKGAGTPLARARDAARRGEHATVRRLLEQKVRGGRGNAEETRLVLSACKQMGDRECLEDVKSKHP